MLVPAREIYRWDGKAEGRGRRQTVDVPVQWERKSDKPALRRLFLLRCEPRRTAVCRSVEPLFLTGERVGGGAVWGDAHGAQLGDAELESVAWAGFHALDVGDPMFALEYGGTGAGVVGEGDHVWRKGSCFWNGAYYQSNVRA